MEKTEKETFRLVGLRLEKKTTNENNQSSVDCGNLWQRFEKEKIFDLIPGKISNEIYAVYHDYEKDDTTPFSYFIGCKVDKHVNTPEGLNELIVPSQHYVKIVAKGVMTGCISEAWKEIWTSNINRRFGFDFEVYDERSRDWNNAEIDIFVSVK